MKEFDFIDELNKRISKAGIEVESGDDAACINGILIAKDIAVEDVHFTAKASLKDIILKTVTANVSDICAMGGIATHILLGISIPANRFDNNELIDAIVFAANAYDLKLIGGDTTSSKERLFLSVTVLGRKNKYILKRSGAKPGDLLFLSRKPGLNMLALENEISEASYDVEKFLHYKVRAETEVAKLLGGCKYVNSCIDISDGLISEAGHIAKASKVSVSVDIDDLPLEHLKKHTDNPLKVFISSGEEYALLFSVSKEGIDCIEDIENKLNTKFYRIGEIIEKSESRVYLKSKGELKSIDDSGFEHEF